VAGLVEWLEEEAVEAVIDATHPFAATMTAHAADAARQLGVPLLVLRRPGWIAGPGDDWHWADDLDGAVELTRSLGRRPFLTIGRQGLDAFAGLGLPALAPLCGPAGTRFRSGASSWSTAARTPSPVSGTCSPGTRSTSW
jgi:precorrin-6A/cobalt-precorrin-6A reductase